MLKRKILKRIFAILGVVAVLSLVGVSAFATSTPVDEAVSAASSAFSTITGTFSIANIMQVVTIAIAAALGFVFFWWAIRKVIRMVMEAFRKGKASV